jgi:hypothetical protein
VEVKMKAEVDLVAQVVTFENLHMVSCPLRCLPDKMDYHFSQKLPIVFHITYGMANIKLMTMDGWRILEQVYSKEACIALA